MSDELEDEISDTIESISEDIAQGSDLPTGDSNEWRNTDGSSVTIVRDPDVEIHDDDLRRAFLDSDVALLRELGNWVEGVSLASTDSRNKQRRSAGLFERDRYVTPFGVFDQFKVAREAAEHDDIVSNILESTEALVFNKVHIECEDEDEENIWNQIIRDLQFDLRLREMWRDLFTYSQYYVSSFWGNKTFKVEGRGEQRSRRKQYQLTVPTALSLIDPMKVIPVGDFLFGQEQLVYVANRTEAAAIDEVIAGKNTTDQVVKNLLVGKYEPSRTEKQRLAEVLGSSADLSNLFTLNPAMVWRHTATTPAYTRFAPVRMTSVFELLDLKHQLRQMDRAHLLGATNFIVLVRKGTDTHPATSAEITNLSNSVKTVARTPLIVGDHRLDIEIITPKLDVTLDPKRYNAIDSRITARLFQIFHLGGFSAGSAGDDSLKLTRIIARGLESRRQMIKENNERNLLMRIFDLNDSLKCRPSIQFTPRSVALDFDPNFLQTVMDLYFDGSVSRETMLGVVDLEQSREAHRREIEKEEFDDIMVPRIQNKGQLGGLMGGDKNGGGTNPDSNRSNPRPRRVDNDVPGDD